MDWELKVCDGCKDPACPVYGCAWVRRCGELLPSNLPLTPVPITEADIRRIVREEIANAMSSGVKP